MEKERISILEIEDRLSQDVSGTFKKSLTDQLIELNRQLKAAMDKGLAPDEFQATQAVSLGAEACTRVVEKIWERQYR